jgi:spore coat-associated protein N
LTITAGAALVALGVISFNAWANFTASQSTTNQIATGTMTITIADGPTAFSSNISGMVPGDHAERFVDIHTGGTLTMSALKLASDASCGGCSSSALDTDATNGLQFVVDTCDQAWTLHAGATATCGGTSASVLSTGPVIMSATTMSNVDTDGTTDHLRFQWLLPSGANDTFQGLTSKIEYVFSGVQPANTYH